MAKLPYSKPTLRAIDPAEMVRKLFAALPAPIKTPGDAAAVIREALAQLAAEERDEALRIALADSKRWVKVAAWSLGAERTK
jgi:hypothetical protein